MDIKTVGKYVGVGAVAVLAGAALTGCTSSGISEDSYSGVVSEKAKLEAVNSQLNKDIETLKLKVDGLESIQETCDAKVEVKDSEETVSKLAKAEADLAAEKAKYALYSDVISAEVREDASVAYINSFLSNGKMSDDEEDVFDAFKSDVISSVEAKGFEVEDEDELLSIVLSSDKDELEFDLSDEFDEPVEGDVAGELKVKFYSDGSDGDRHTVKLNAKFVFEDGELVSAELI